MGKRLIAEQNKQINRIVESEREMYGCYVCNTPCYRIHSNNRKPMDKFKPMCEFGYEDSRFSLIEDPLLKELRRAKNE